MLRMLIRAYISLKSYKAHTKYHNSTTSIRKLLRHAPHRHRWYTNSMQKKNLSSVSWTPLKNANRAIRSLVVSFTGKKFGRIRRNFILLGCGIARSLLGRSIAGSLSLEVCSKLKYNKTEKATHD